MINEVVKLVEYNSISLAEIMIDELDLVKTPLISKKMNSLIRDLEKPLLIVILGRVTYIDSTGISYLIDTKKEIEHTGGKMVLVCRRETILQVFDAVNLKHFIKIFPTVDVAEKYLREYAESSGSS